MLRNRTPDKSLRVATKLFDSGIVALGSRAERQSQEALILSNAKGLFLRSVDDVRDLVGHGRVRCYTLQDVSKRLRFFGGLALLVLLLATGIPIVLVLQPDSVEPPVLVVVGKRAVEGREIVDFRVDVPHHRPVFLHPLSEAKVIGETGERAPDWHPQPPPFQTYFTNRSATFGVEAPVDFPVWQLRLILIAEASRTRTFLMEMEYRIKLRRFRGHFHVSPTTTHWLKSDFITNSPPHSTEDPDG